MPKGQQSPDRPAVTERSALPGFDELAIGANGAEARRASEWLDTACRRRNVPQAPVERLALCLYEVLANVIAHGGSTALSAPIRLLLEVTLERDCSKASVTVSDAGVAFNPLFVPKRTLPKTLGEASTGGLGLVMIRRCSDWLDYRHEGGRNHLTFGARWNAR
ncbi:MAG: ATP-binding protein [Betaproteobacteria bacterium]|nr:ATP-binding protein [Betaproteobacteria bacterium]